MNIYNLVVKIKNNRKILLNLFLIFLIYEFVIYLLVFLTNYHNLRAPLGNFSLLSLIAPLVRWDAGHYLTIAIDGYVYPNMAFFPLYPLLVKSLNFFIGNIILSGLIVSWVSLYLAIFFLFKLIVIKLKDKNIAYLSIIFLLIFPFAIFYSTIYTEALFLFFTVAAFYFSEKKNWLLVGLLACFASATRIFGILLFGVFLLVYLSDRKFNLKKIDKNLLFIFLAPLGLIFYMIFLQIKFGDPLIFLKAQKEWATYGVFSMPWHTLFRQFRRVFDFNLLRNVSSLGYFMHVRDFFFWPIFLICSIFITKLLGWRYALYNFLTLLAISCRFPMMSANRYLMILFPVYILLAVWSKNQVMRFFIFFFFACLFFFYTTIFIKGDFVG